MSSNLFVANASAYPSRAGKDWRGKANGQVPNSWQWAARQWSVRPFGLSAEASAKGGKLVSIISSAKTNSCVFRLFSKSTLTRATTRWPSRRAVASSRCLPTRSPLATQFPHPSRCPPGKRPSFSRATSSLVKFIVSSPAPATSWIHLSKPHTTSIKSISHNGALAQSAWLQKRAAIASTTHH